ncbi:MAG TPA: DsbA family protein [Myxococcota bacterium]|jgi:2-hydroxychromene-2-carboxylate isomerase|nr:DsbA family protein [Myxococcota bacterium]
MKLPFYFDYACPWAYLGSARAEPYFAEVGADLDFRPVYLPLLREPGAGGLGEMGDRKKRNYRNDMLHWAELCGAQLSPEAGARRPDTRLLLQCAFVAKDEGRFREFHYPAYRARWAEAQDVADEGVLRGLLRGAGLDPDAALARARSPELAARLDAETNDAVARGVFGVPTVFVGDEMFWGNDRFEVARHYVLKGR